MFSTLLSITELTKYSTLHDYLVSLKQIMYHYATNPTMMRELQNIKPGQKDSKKHRNKNTSVKLLMMIQLSPCFIHTTTEQTPMN
jgi:hypothetical protein